MEVDKANQFSRLPTNVVPNHYFLNIRPDISNFSFSGSEIVHVEVREKTKTIVLNSVEIAFQSASFVSNNQERSALRIEPDKENELVVITFADELELGPGQLKLEFTGKINDQLNGCYRCKYTTAEGELRYGLSCQFESVYARKAFPCWDEPAIRAKFDLTLVAPKDRVALSNMPVVEESDDPVDPTKRVLRFGTTPSMSTYLLCYVIGEYDHVQAASARGIPIRVYTPVGKAEQGKYALDVAVRCLNFYEDYFKIPYPLPKMDLIAVPDFLIAGLITYRETAILFDPEQTSTARKEFIALVVCHEVSHMWFGNLVTMSWWQELWLKEGFASFMMYLAVDHLFPSYNIWQQFVINPYAQAINLDALHNSHKIEVTVNHPREIEEIFDAISYRKGASLIRMLLCYLGGEDFQKGMHAYLSKWAYKSTVTDDLWDSLEEASAKPVRSIMSTWTKQKGFPVIHVARRLDGSTPVLSLTQEKFSIDGVLTEQDRQALWLVPISIVSQSNAEPMKLLLETKSQEVVMKGVEAGEWLKLNQNMTSFYRVNYPVEWFLDFKQSIENKSLACIDRLNILSDVFAMVRSGKTNAGSLFSLLDSYRQEDEYPVWHTIISCLEKFDKVLEYTDLHETFHSFVRSLLAGIYSKVGSKPAAGEHHQYAMLRNEIFSLLVSCQDPAILKEAKEQFELHAKKIIQIPADLRMPIYRAIASDCDEKTFESFFQLHREADLHEEKNRIAQALGSSKDPARIQKLIDFAMSTEVRSQDAGSVIGAVSAHSKMGRDIAWNYFKKNHNVFRKKYESGQIIQHLVTALLSDFATEEQLKDASLFFDANPVPGTERNVQQSLESIKANIDLLARDWQTIKTCLNC